MTGKYVLCYTKNNESKKLLANVMQIDKDLLRSNLSKVIKVDGRGIPYLLYDGVVIDRPSDIIIRLSQEPKMPEQPREPTPNDYPGPRRQNREQPSGDIFGPSRKPTTKPEPLTQLNDEDISGQDPYSGQSSYGDLVDVDDEMKRLDSLGGNYAE